MVFRSKQTNKKIIKNIYIIHMVNGEELQEI